MCDAGQPKFPYQEEVWMVGKYLLIIKECVCRQKPGLFKFRSISSMLVHYITGKNIQIMKAFTWINMICILTNCRSLN